MPFLSFWVKCFIRRIPFRKMKGLFIALLHGEWKLFLFSSSVVRTFVFSTVFLSSSNPTIRLSLVLPKILGLHPIYPFIISIWKSRKNDVYTNFLILQSEKAMIFIVILSLVSFQILLAVCHIEFCKVKWIFF